MLTSILVGIGGVVFLMVAWMVVQNYWGKTFAEYMTDEDAMAGRTKCSNCGCTSICQNKQNQTTEDIHSKTNHKSYGTFSRL